MANIQVIAKDSQQVLVNAATNNATVSVPSVVQIQADINNVAQIKRLGNQAIVVLKDGEKIVIENFFTVSPTTNALVFQNAQNQLTWVQFTKSSSAAATVYYENIDSIAPLLASDSGFLQSMTGPWGYTLGGVALATGVALGVSSSSDSNNGGTTPSSLIISQNNADALRGKAAADATIEITLQDGTKRSTKADAAGNWSIQPNPIAENQKASVTEKKADGSTVSSVEVSRGDDAPATPSAAANVTDDQAPNVGNVSDKATTNDNLPRLSGTAVKGDVITIYDNGTAIGSTTVADNGTWSFIPGTALSDGQHILTFTAKDAGGKESPKSPAITILVDTQASAAAINAPTITDDQAPHTGNVANGGASNDAKPTISGSGTPNDTVKIYVDDNVTASVTVAADGSWRYTPANNLSDGTHKFSYTTTDLAGNESAKSPEISLLIDTIKPVTPIVAATVTDNSAPVLGNVSNNAVSNDSRPTFSGTGANSGEQITLYDQGVVIGSVTVAANGTWRFSPATALTEGNHVITYTVTDLAGNQSSTAPASNFSIDLTAPNAILAITAISDDTDLAGDFITADSSLSVHGTISNLGSNERVQISIDNGVTWSDVNLNANTWQYTDSRILNDGNYVYLARVVDAAGNSSAVMSKTVKVDTALTTSSIVISSISDDTGIAGDFITRDNVLSIHGTVSTLAAGQKAQISLDNGNTWLDLTVNNGTWQYADSRVLTDGEVIYRVRVANSDGSIIEATAAQKVIIDTTVPTAPSQLPTITDDQSPILVNIGQNGFSNDSTPSIRGVGVAGDIVMLYNHDAVLGSSTVANNGQWSYTLSTALSDGSYSIRYSYKDAAGNETEPSESVAFTIDTVAPATPSSGLVVTDGLAPTTGNVANGGSSNDTTPSLSGGGAAAGEIIHIYDQKVLVASVTAVLNGSWSYTPTTALSEGMHRFSYMRTDAAGNQSEPSPETILIVDTTVPTAKIEFVSIGNDSGLAGDFKTASTSIVLNGKVSTLANDEHLQISLDGGTNWIDLIVNSGSWTYTDTRVLSNGNISYQVRAIDAAGNAAAPVTQVVSIDTTLPKAAITINNINDDTGNLGDYITSDTTLTLNGSATGLDTGEKLQLSVDNGQTWVNLILNSTNWSYSDTRILQNGAYRYDLRVVNSSDIPIGVSDSKTVSIDTTAPEAPSIAPLLSDDQAPNIGNLLNNAVTNDTQPTVSGSGLGANMLIRILDNGVAIGSTSSDANGAWSFTPTAAWSEGTHVIGYALVDVAGNQSGSSPTVKIVVDTTAPVFNISITSISDDTGNQGDFLTADNSLTLYGSVTGLALGEKLQISLDGSTWSDVVVSNNSWSFNDSRTLDNGTYTYQLRGMDNAGNVGSIVSRQVTVDSNAPTAAIRIDRISDDTGIAGDFITNDSSLTIQGTVTGLLLGDKAQISRDNGTSWQNLTINNNTWSFNDARSLTAGSYVYMVRVVNSIETAVGASASQTVIFDNTAPTYSSVIQIVRDSNNDGFINSTEQGGSNTTDINVLVSSNAQVGDVITVKQANTVIATFVVGQDVVAGATKLITGISLPAEGNTLNISAETRDVAGNLSTIVLSDSASINSDATHPLLQQGSNVADTFNGNSNNNWFEGREGNDIFNLGVLGGQDTLFYNVLSVDATGGNGSDVVNQFSLGNSNNAEADKIDLKALLMNYNYDSNDGAAHFINGVATIDSGDTITQYLSVQNTGGNSVLSIDRDGNGTLFASTVLLTLNNTSVDLATLLANQQIIIG